MKTTFKDAAEALWQLLDDIDTQDDACRDNDALFRTRVRELQKKREDWAVSSDGQTLEWAFEEMLKDSWVLSELENENPEVGARYEDDDGWWVRQGPMKWRRE